MYSGLLLSVLVKSFVLSQTYPNLGPSWGVCTPQIGLSAPQGCGKTTVVESLEYLFKEAGKYVLLLSFPDMRLPSLMCPPRASS